MGAYYGRIHVGIERKCSIAIVIEIGAIKITAVSANVRGRSGREEGTSLMGVNLFFRSARNLRSERCEHTNANVCCEARKRGERKVEHSRQESEVSIKKSAEY